MTLDWDIRGFPFARAYNTPLASLHGYDAGEASRDRAHVAEVILH